MTEAQPSGHSTMSSALPEAVRYHGWISRLILSWIGHGPLLEIGPGYGQYTGELAKRTERVLAVDIDESCAELARGKADNVEAMVADVEAESFHAAIPTDTWESIVCLNVLEHLAHDGRVLARARGWLKPGGRLVLALPAHPALFGPMDSLAGHHRRYTRRDIRDKLTAAGLACLHAAYINPVGGLGWWFNAKFCRPCDLSSPGINRQIRVFDRWVLPVSRLLTPLTRRFFGQSLFVVAQRPSQG